MLLPRVSQDVGEQKNHVVTKVLDPDSAKVPSGISEDRMKYYRISANHQEVELVDADPICLVVVITKRRGSMMHSKYFMNYCEISEILQ